MDLKTIPGENIDKAVSLARAALIRLETFGKVPEDIVRIILRIFQTSSVPAFNEIFQHLETTRRAEHVLASGRLSEKFTPAALFRAATTQYRSLCAEGAWHGVRTSGDAIFTSTAKGTLCWNCGDPGHSLPDCKVPRDEARILANKKARRKAIKKAAKDKGRSTSAPTPPTTVAAAAPGTGKWRPPSPEENNRRVINGKPMWYNASRKRWYPDRAHSDSGNVASVNAAVVPVSSPPVASGGQSVASSQSGADSAAQLAGRQAYANAYATVYSQLSQSGL